jgi:hypothetical protein
MDPEMENLGLKNHKIIPYIMTQKLNTKLTFYNENYSEPHLYALHPRVKTLRVNHS